MIRVLLLVVGLLTLLMGCGRPETGGAPGTGTGASAQPSGPTVAPPSEPATISGTITQLQNGSILVEEQPGAEAGGRKIVFTITPETRLFARAGEQLRPITAAELVQGTPVQAWAEGAIAESYPEQARARAIVTVEDAEPQGTPAAGLSNGAQGGTMLPERQADIVGTITAIEGGVLVEEHPQATIGNKIIFQVSDTTRVFQRVGADLQPKHISDLVVGQRVEAWSTGAMAQSFPAQAGAAVIVFADNAAAEATQEVAAPPDRAPDLTGTITQATNTIWIDGRTVLFVGPGTQFFRKSGDALERIEAVAIVEGQQATVWLDGLRYAPQAHADAVAIVVRDQ